MSDGSESERLLDDVLNDVAPASFRADLLDRTLHEVRRRRHRRQWSQGLTAVVLLLAAAWIGMRTRSPARQASIPKPGLLRIVSSTPLRPSMFVASRAGSVTMISSTPSNYNVLSTEPFTHDFRELNDEELLGFMAGKPSVLVRQGPHQAELLIVDAAHDGAYPVGMRESGD